MKVSQKNILLFTFVAMLIVNSLWAANSKTTKLKLKIKTDKKNAAVILPTRLPGMGLDSLNGQPGTAIFKPINNYFDDDKVSTNFTINGRNHMFYLEYGTITPGKRYSGKLYYPAVGNILKPFWESEAIRQVKTKKDIPAAVRLKNLLKGKEPVADKKAKKNKKNSSKKNKTKGPKKFTIKSGKPGKKHYAKVYAYPLPPYLGGVERRQLWNNVFAPAGGMFSIYDSDKWERFLKKKGHKYTVALIPPPGQPTLNRAFFRSCMVLTGKLPNKAKTEITIFDDNLNGIYGEAGVDSIRIGTGITQASSIISAGEELYSLENGITVEKKSGVNVELAPLTDTAKGKVRLIWKSSGTELLICQISQAENYFSLVKMKKKSFSHKKDPDAEEGVAKFLPVTIPVGTYSLAGGLAVKRAKKKSGYSRYVCFGSTKKIQVKNGETTTIILGDPITMQVKFSAIGEKRTFTCSYPVGSFGEVYKWLFPRPENASLTLKGRGPEFEGTMKRSMNIVDKGSVFLDRSVTYDPVQMVPENGPFDITIKYDSKIFPALETKLTLKSLSAKRK